MAKKHLTAIDMTSLEILNHRLHSIAGNHSTPVESLVWYDSTAKRIKFRTNAANLMCVTDGGDLTAGSVANSALTTNPLARANHTGTQTASTISDFDTQVRTNRLDQMAAPTADVSLNTRKITGLGTPSADTDAATKGYVDNVVAGLAWKDAVRVGTLASITLSGTQTIDGVAVSAGERVLVKNQSTASGNGIYVVAAGAWSRATDADTASELQGMAVMIEEGTQAGSQWVLTTDAPITVGTTSLSYSQFGGGSAYSAGDGLTLTANDFAVGAGNGISVSANAVAVDPVVVVRKYAADIGNNSLTSITVTHNLNTKDITYSVRTVADDSFVDCDVVATTVNTATFTFAVAPTTNQYRVIIHG